MRHLAATKDNHNFHAVAIFEKTFDFSDFDVKVIVANFEANLHLFKLGLFFASFFAIFGFFFHLLVLVFSPIDDFYDRRICARGNFYEVYSLVFSEVKGFFARHNAELFSVSSDYANFWITDFSV